MQRKKGCLSIQLLFFFFFGLFLLEYKLKLDFASSEIMY